MAKWEACIRRLWHARCTATNDDEHAVSTATEGPRRSRKYDSRFAMMLSAPPVLLQASTLGRSVDPRYPYSLEHATTKTHVCAWRCALDGIPAYSKASQATSSSRRCCGSILAASRREISKNCASNASMSLRNEPHRVVWAGAAATSGEPSSNGSHRSGGTSAIEQRPSSRNCHSSSGPDIPPGNRHPNPTTAIGSHPAPDLGHRTSSASDCDSGAMRKPTRALIVG